MPSTVGVNKLSVVHKESGGTVTFMPDVCLTPTPGGPVPIPYPNVAMSADADQTAKTVTCDGNPICLEGSTFGRSNGGRGGVERGGDERLHRGRGGVRGGRRASAPVAGGDRVSAGPVARPPRAGERRRLAAVVVAAAAIVVAWAARAAPPSAALGTMNAKVTVLGEVGPSSEGSERSSKSVDPAPVVLWSGLTPKVVLRFESDVNHLTGRVEQRFVRTDGRKEGPFPITVADTLPHDAVTEDELDVYDPQSVAVADVDGDGTDELVLPRGDGSVEVVGASRVVSRTRHVVRRGKIAGYFPRSLQRARAGGKDVVFVLYERRLLRRATEEELVRAGFAERHQLVRIDERGATRLTFEVDGFRPEKVIAVGALNRPGSSQIDELVAMSEMPGEKDPVLSRHAADGKLLGAPRRIYVPSPPSNARFAFVPQCGRAIAFGEGRVYFFAPEKPANWVRAADVSRIGGREQGGRLLGVVDPSAPKALVWKGNEVFAVDEEQAYYGVANGAWTRLKRPGPAYKLTSPSPAHKLDDVYPSPDGGDGFLVVHTREMSARELSDDELVAAAERFLPARRLRRARALMLPSLTRWDRSRDELISEERDRKGGQGPTSVEDWRARYPDSFATWTAQAQEGYRVTLRVALITPVDPTRDDYRDYDGWLKWRDELVTPAETVFAVIRDTRAAASFRVEGQPLVSPDPVLALPIVSFRAQGAAMTAVLAMEIGLPPRQTRRFATVTGP